MFSVMYTGMNFLPLCTAIVCPTISGTMVERRDHVLTTFFSNRRLSSSTFFIRWSSVNGAFFSDLPISLVPSSLHDEAVSLFIVAGLVTPRGMDPGRDRVPLHGRFGFASRQRRFPPLQGRSRH